MSTKVTKRLVPQLRFPGFRDAEGWEEKALLYLSEYPLSNGVFNDPKKVGSGYKLINVSDMYIESAIKDGGLSLVAISREEFERNRVNYGDIFFTRSSLVKSGIAASNIYLGNSNDVTFDGHLIRLRPNKRKSNPVFINYLLRTREVRHQLVAKGKTATMTTIGQADVATTRILIPDLNEQNKIADSLSSIDDLITAQSRKIEAIKVHKKGLMQQLFPAEGKTMPHLRFSEFHGAPEWKKRKIGEVFKVTRGEVLSMNLVTDTQSVKFPYPVYSSQTKRNGLAGFYSEFLYEDAITWTTDGANAGDVNYRYGKFYCTNVCGVLLNNAGQANACTAAVINSVAKNYVSYVGNPKLMNGVMSEIEVLLPEVREQNKIADCLSSIDDLNTKNLQKLDALKVHKKGLLQGLFPSTAEGEV